MLKTVFQIISISLLVMLLSSYNLLAQSGSINQTDAQGKKQGKWQKSDENGRLIYTGEFSNDLPTGRFTYYDTAARVKAITDFTENGTKAFTTTFNRYGKKNSEGNYLNEKREGLWKFYNDEEVLISEEFYQNGIASGTWKNYYQNGALLEEINYKNGIKHGPWKQYFHDGPTKLSAVFENGKLEGLATFYHPSGKVMISGTYKNNFKHGVWMQLSDKGIAEKKEVWDNGFLIAEEYYDKARERMVKEEK